MTTARKIFALSTETAAIVAAFQGMTLGEQMTFSGLAKIVKFTVKSSSPAYHSARRIAERDHGIFIGTMRGIGFFRGNGVDMADSLEPMAVRMKRIAKRSIARADLAIANNLPEDKHQRALERRNRASIIYSTSGTIPAASNRKRPEPAPTAPAHPGFGALLADTRA